MTATLICFMDWGRLAGQGILPVFQAQLGAVAGFPLISIGIALIFCAMLDLEHVLTRWPIPGAAIVATLSYSLYLHTNLFSKLCASSSWKKTCKAVAALWSIWSRAW
ncbi:hypothetical protein [Rhizobium sp. ERR 942]|uniref:hypothetical protein n=1 Tax=Rhizobium sp. ERR 942 TaxID=2572676 RepID=UPI0011AA25FE|nr:hypothetical protein [Rhizobium sp. ERR 942]